MAAGRRPAGPGVALRSSAYAGDYAEGSSPSPAVLSGTLRIWRAPAVTSARTGGASCRSGSGRRPRGTGRADRRATPTGAGPFPASPVRPPRAGCRPGRLSRNSRIVVTPPPSRTSLPSAAPRARSRTVAGSSSTKWNVVSDSVIAGRLWWVITNTGVWKGGFSPHQPCHSWFSQGPRWGPNLLRPMISAPMLRAKSRVK